MDGEPAAESAAGRASITKPDDAPSVSHCTMLVVGESRPYPATPVPGLRYSRCGMSHQSAGGFATPTRTVALIKRLRPCSVRGDAMEKQTSGTATAANKLVQDA